MKQWWLSVHTPFNFNVDNSLWDVSGAFESLPSPSCHGAIATAMRASERLLNVYHAQGQMLHAYNVCACQRVLLFCILRTSVAAHYTGSRSGHVPAAKALTSWWIKCGGETLVSKGSELAMGTKDDAAARPLIIFSFARCPSLPPPISLCVVSFLFPSSFLARWPTNKAIEVLLELERNNLARKEATILRIFSL